jgi:4-diphosphocytidyl-2-C-methyl-D-erythritol kinase
VLRRAYAKVNLALSVGPALGPEAGDRAGYHPIASWVHAVDLFDEVVVEHAPGQARGLSRRPARESRFELEWAEDAPRPAEIDWPIEHDLGARAHRLLEEVAGEPLPVRIAIRKRIPLGGGLGGGSSDAAAVMLAVNDLFGLGLSVGRLAALSGRLGSDVAFFLDEGGGEEPPRPAVVLGVGEIIERAPRREGGLTLVFPPFGCPTAEVYRAYDLEPRPLRAGAVRSLAAGAAGDEGLFNDLAGAAERVRPELGVLRRAVARAAGRPVHMTGSGSTLFLLGPGGGLGIEGAGVLDARLV